MAVELLGNMQNRTRETGRSIVRGVSMGTLGVFVCGVYFVSEIYSGVRGRFDESVRNDYIAGMAGSAYVNGDKISRFWNFGTLFWTPSQRAEAKSAVDDALEEYRFRDARIDRWLNEAGPEGVLDEVAKSMVQLFRLVKGQNG